MGELRCPYCRAKDIIRFGIRKSRFGNIQKYLCKGCHRSFTDKPLSYTSYPAKIILKAVSLYNLGYSQNNVTKQLFQRYGIKVPQRTLGDWITKYLNPCTYYILRKQAVKLYKPKDIILSEKLQHRQVYNFKLHKAKLALLQDKKALPEGRFNSLKAYLDKIQTDDFPHHIFTNVSENKGQESRASKLSMKLLKITSETKNNHANRLAELALKLAPDNKARHQAVQDFMLINDSTTIATEVPVYLTDTDITYFEDRGFGFNLKDCQTPITGHIDILQIRNNLIYILDYKPEAERVKPIEQLTIYALALAARTKIPVKDFKCAWFDERNYYKFFPLKAVYEKRS